MDDDELMRRFQTVWTDAQIAVFEKWADKVDARGQPSWAQQKQLRDEVRAAGPPRRNGTRRPSLKPQQRRLLKPLAP